MCSKFSLSLFFGWSLVFEWQVTLLEMIEAQLGNLARRQTAFLGIS